jgi:hypothetical protein
MGGRVFVGWIVARGFTSFGQPAQCFRKAVGACPSCQVTARQARIRG